MTGEGCGLAGNLRPGAKQAAYNLAFGLDWPGTGLVFTREDGAPAPAQRVSSRFETLACRAGLPPVRLHDLRHGAASLARAAGLDSKYISALLRHSRPLPVGAAPGRWCRSYGRKLTQELRL